MKADFTQPAFPPDSRLTRQVPPVDTTLPLGYGRDSFTEAETGTGGSSKSRGHMDTTATTSKVPPNFFLVCLLFTLP